MGTNAVARVGRRRQYSTPVGPKGFAQTGRSRPNSATSQSIALLVVYAHPTGHSSKRSRAGTAHPRWPRPPCSLVSLASLTFSRSPFIRDGPFVALVRLESLTYTRLGLIVFRGKRHRLLVGGGRSLQLLAVSLDGHRNVVRRIVADRAVEAALAAGVDTARG